MIMTALFLLWAFLLGLSIHHLIKDERDRAYRKGYAHGRFDHLFEKESTPWNYSLGSQ